MTLPKIVRHVQTQHGDDSVDVENIFLFRANVNCTHAEAPAAEVAGGSSTNVAEIGAECDVKEEEKNSINGVWIYEASEDGGSQVSKNK